MFSSRAAGGRPTAGQTIYFVLLIVALAAIVMALAFPAIEYLTVYRTKALAGGPKSLITPQDTAIPPDTGVAASATTETAPPSPAPPSAPAAAAEKK